MRSQSPPSALCRPWTCCFLLLGVLPPRLCPPSTQTPVTSDFAEINLMGSAFLISASLKPQLLEEMSLQNTKPPKTLRGRRDGYPHGEGESNLQVIHPSAPPPKAMHIIQALLRGTKKSHFGKKSIFFPSHDDAQEANTSPNAQEKLCGKSASRKQTK